VAMASTIFMGCSPYEGVARVLISCAMRMLIFYRWLKGPIVLRFLSYGMAEPQVCHILHKSARSMLVSGPASTVGIISQAAWGLQRVPAVRAGGR
jgi:hypothetical protein